MGKSLVSCFFQTQCSTIENRGSTIREKCAQIWKKNAFSTEHFRFAGGRYYDVMVTAPRDSSVTVRGFGVAESKNGSPPYFYFRFGR